MANWIPFITDLGEGPASVIIDVDLANSGADAGRGTLVVASVPLRSPGEHGMGEQQEVDAIDAVIEKIHGMLASGCDAVFAATMRSEGTYDAVFYLPASKAQAAEMLLGVGLSPLEGDFIIRQDPTWSMYHELFPAEGDMRRALGLRALMLLAEGGDDLSIPRGIAHEINLPGRNAADAAKQKLAQMGYTIVSETSDASEDLPFRLAFQRVEAPEASALLTSGELLDQLAQELDGEYAGWECPPAG